MKRKISTSFEEHIGRWHEAKGIGVNLLRVEDIDPKDMAVVAAEAFSLWSNLESQDQKHSAYVGVLHKYGIMCPHPQNKRLYEGTTVSLTPLYDYRWFDCEMCGCAVFNDHYFRRARETKKIVTG